MSKYIYPVSGYRLSQGFGANASYYSKYGQRGHNGLDLAVNAGTPVKASRTGRVVWEGVGKSGSSYAGWMGDPAGIAAIIDHGDVYTGYAHMQRTIVSRGQRVTQGQVIGYVGSTGDASGPHCHFEFIGRPPNWNNGYAGRLSPPAIGTTSTSSKGGKTVNESDLTAIYRYGPLGLGGYKKRARRSKEGSNVYLGKTAAFVIGDHYKSGEARQKRAALAAQFKSLESTIAALKKKPGNSSSDADKKLKAIKDALGIK